MSLTEAQRQDMQTQLKAAIDDTDERAGVALAQAALAEGVTPIELFSDVIQPVLKEIGDAFARLDVFLPDLMRAGLVVKTMQLEVLEPAILKSGAASGSAGTVVIGTAQGDIHDIGKNMVALMLQVNGFKVVDLGTNVSPQGFLDAARREHADIIAMSSLLTPTLPYIKDLVKRLESFGEREPLPGDRGRRAHHVVNGRRRRGWMGSGKTPSRRWRSASRLMQQRKERSHPRKRGGCHEAVHASSGCPGSGRVRSADRRIELGHADRAERGRQAAGRVRDQDEAGQRGHRPIRRRPGRPAVRGGPGARRAAGRLLRQHQPAHPVQPRGDPVRFGCSADRGYNWRG